MLLISSVSHQNALCLIFGEILKTSHGLYQWSQTAGPWSTSSPSPSVTQPDVKYIMEPLLWQQIIRRHVSQLYQCYSLHAKS